MTKSREERVAEHKRLEALLPKVSEELKKIPGVAFVVIALKETGNRLTDDIVFQVHVDRKKPREELDPANIIPDRIEGVPTDVLEVTESVLHENTNKYRPLLGGCQVNGNGTMGCLVTINASGKVGLLTNHHVFDGSAVGKPVGQPGSASDCGCCVCCDVAKWTNAVKNARVDAAVAELNGDMRYTAEILDSRIGPVLGTAAAMVGDPVKKHGRTTEYTEGTVSSITFPVTIDGHTWNNQIRIAPSGTYTDWSEPGDSGSAVLNADNMVVGLHFSGQNGGPQGNANHIANVETDLGVTVLSVGTAGAIPISANAGSDAVSVSDPTQALAAIEEELASSPAAAKWMEAYREHGDEVRRLVNRNREVKVAWQRFQGPAFTAHLLKSAREPGYLVPEEIEGVSLQNLLLRMAVVLQNQGSPALREAVKARYLEVLRLTEECRSLPDLVARAKRSEANREPVEVGV